MEEQREIGIMLSHIANYRTIFRQRKRNFVEWLSFPPKR
jgi:hypothetical protein